MLIVEQMTFFYAISPFGILAVAQTSDRILVQNTLFMREIVCVSETKTPTCDP